MYLNYQKIQMRAKKLIYEFRNEVGLWFWQEIFISMLFFRSRFLEEYLKQNTFLENLAQDTSAPHGSDFFSPSEQPCSSYVASTKGNCSIQSFFVEVDFSKITGNRIVSLQIQVKTHQLHLDLIFFGHRINPVRVMQRRQNAIAAIDFDRNWDCLRFLDGLRMVLIGLDDCWDRSEVL